SEFIAGLSETTKYHIGDYTTYESADGLVLAVPIKKDGHGYIYQFLDGDDPVDPFDKMQLDDYVVESPISQFPKVTVRYIGGEFHAIDWFAANFDDATWLRYKYGLTPGS